MLQQDLATSTSLVPAFAKDQSAAYAQGATAAVRTTVERRRARVHVTAAVTDLATQKNRQTIHTEGSEAEGIVARLNEVAKQLDPQRAGSFSTKSDEALKSFTAAATATDNGVRASVLRQAITADPSFGLAQVALLEISPGEVSADPRAADRFTSLDRARYFALLARIKHAPLSERASAEAAVVHLAPNNVEALAELGWARFLQGKAAEGEQLLRKASALNPENVNLPLQLAQGFVASRRFGQAAQLVQSLSAANPNVLPALAAIKLLSGDKRGADDTFSKFASLVPAGSPARTFVQEQWKALVTGQLPRTATQGSSPYAPGYQAFLSGRFSEAVTFWRAVVQRTGAMDLRARAMVAASLERAGQPDEARKISVLPFLPEFADPYASISFNEMRRILKMQ